MKQIAARENYLFVEYSEPYQLETFIALMQEVAEICKREKFAKVLVDAHGMGGTISTIERFKLGVTGADTFRGVAQVAIIYRREELNWFAETVGINRGANVRVFGELDEALNWLGVSSPYKT